MNLALWTEPPLSDATVVFAASMLFSPELMDRLAEQLAACRSVRCVASLKRFADGALVGFREELPPEPCETSWTAEMLIVSDVSGGAGGEAEAHAGSPVHIYVRD